MTDLDTRIGSDPVESETTSPAPVSHRRGTIIDWGTDDPDGWTITPKPAPPPPPEPVISPWPHRIAVVAALVVVVCAQSVSFVATADEAFRTHAATRALSYLVPIAIDGALIACAASIFAWAVAGKPGKRPKLPTIAGAGFLALSSVLNAAHAGPSVWGRGIAAVIPVSLFVAVELAFTLLGRRTNRH